MPCMPARREIHTGRYNFLHRSWGPLEPFDDSMPEALHQNGVHSHKVTDHHHYWYVQQQHAARSSSGPVALCCALAAITSAELSSVSVYLSICLSAYLPVFLSVCLSVCLSLRSSREDGGATYHQRYRTHEFVRGQEGDWWKGDAEKLRDINYPDREIFPPIKTPGATKKRQDAINREQAPTTEAMPQYKYAHIVTQRHTFKPTGQQNTTLAACNAI